jgi:hypothetical protein
VEVNHRPRERGQSKYGLHNRLWVGIVDLFGVMWLRRRQRLPVVSMGSDSIDPSASGKLDAADSIESDPSGDHR